MVHMNFSLLYLYPANFITIDATVTRKLGGADTKLPNSKTHRMPSFFWLPQGKHRLLFISVIFGNSYTVNSFT